MKSFVTLVTLLTLGLLLLPPLPTRGQSSVWAISESHGFVQLLVANGAPPDYLDQVRLGISAFSRYSQDSLGRSLQKTVHFHVFPDAQVRLSLMQSIMNLTNDQLRSALGIGVVGGKGCLDCSQPNGTIWLRVDEPWMPGPRQSAPVSLAFVTAHALTHMWQFGQGSARKEPQWWQEGVADYVGYRAVDSVGHIPFGDAAEHMKRVVLNSPVPMHRSLEGYGLTFEIANRVFYQWNQLARGAGYSLFALLAYRLTEQQSPAALTTYYQELGRGRSWPDAFETAFKVKPEEAYLDLLRWVGL